MGPLKRGHFVSRNADLGVFGAKLMEVMSRWQWKRLKMDPLDPPRWKMDPPRCGPEVVVEFRAIFKKPLGGARRAP